MATLQKTRAQLTQKTLEALTAEEHGLRFALPGGLSGQVRAKKGGGISVDFQYRYRGEDGKPRMKRIGSWPKSNLKSIYSEADQLAAVVTLGDDPIAKERREKAAAEALRVKAEEARLAAERIAAVQAKEQAAEAAAPTLNALFKLWDELHGATLDSHWRIVRQSQWRCHIEPVIGAMKIKDVNTKPLLDHLDLLRLEGKGETAHKVLALIRQVAKWGKARGFLKAGNPLLDLDPPIKPKDLKAKDKADNFDAQAYLQKHGLDAIGEDGEDDKAGRALSFPELRELLSDKLPASTQSDTGKAMIRFMLATGVRASQAVRLRWKWVLLEERVVIFPAGSMKSRQAHHVHLSDFALEQLLQMQAIQRGDFVFQAPKKDNDHVLRSNVGNDITSRQFYRIDEESSEAYQARLVKRLQSRRACHDFELYNLSGGKWTLYDLRRTVATRLSEITGSNMNTIKPILAHVKNNGVTDRYDRFSNWAQRCAALDTLGAALQTCQMGQMPDIRRVA